MNMTIWMGIMLIASLAWTVWFLKKPLADNGIDLRQSNVDLGKQRKLELQSDLDKDLIDQEQFEFALDEISSTLAVELEQKNVKTSNTKSGGLSIFLVLILLPFFSIGVYQNLSTYVSTPIVASVVDSAPLSLEQSVEKIKQHLQDEPNDDKAWAILGLSYFELNQDEASVNAYEKAYQINPNNPRLLIEYASTLISVNDNQFSDQSVVLIKQALKLDANAPDALYLAGMFAISMQDFELAKGLWNRALSALPEQSADRQALLGILDELRRAESGQVSSTVTVNVVISDQILASRSAEDYLMIYVKAAKGRPMPIAIEKLKLKDFSGQVVLSDMNSVMPTKLLSEHDKVLVVARLSRTGGAMKQADDIQITSDVVGVSDNPIITLRLN
ncbi:Cytochrome c heme lyase subunit CcmH [Bathymodiolus heckerae thiotrophic gill symbiont]|uniref:c-type cytochrome biogenesis protein CcmI n=1 Tax=Bathymodiolus heckerae thiotrophic gill symbiont TaxID=1052212 RepID=UPI0010B08170|nr:c-type cytochrome biogenesis protein CcmI [Bathymodiolus heckerae thiotrophic gill symbiont]CAC9594933.1 Cytochrome c heme lyase subunit CcmH [uncultured Gammaproteobacteria bacterium]CAC9596561.1 Cytochrome c heme lyase subunit CcmH [uncultured Gammaproteobacteria bacterium]SHN89837.1 Cytochrome c heme lyase subunit CcmH [Bathymodiolus heckerae thiotrophic gill symbiont]